MVIDISVLCDHTPHLLKDIRFYSIAFPGVDKFTYDIYRYTQMMYMGVLVNKKHIYFFAEIDATRVIKGGGATCPGYTVNNETYVCTLLIRKLEV